MALIPTFTAQAPRRGSLEPSADNGSADVFLAIAKTSGQISGRLMEMAGDAARREGRDAGAAAAMTVSMPGVDFAFDASSPMTTPQRGRAQGMTRGMAGDVRSIVSAAAQKHGVDANAMLTIAMLESSGNPNAKNPNSSAGGLFQFIDSTASQYGLANRFDPVAASDAAARLAKDNAGHLRKVLGREPTAGELYLAHQQGAGGAARLLANPGASAVSIVGSKAVTLNGGTSGMTAGEFASIWTAKAGDRAAAVSSGGAPVAAAGGQVQVTLTGAAGAVPQMAAGTIRGDAYNAAAIDIHQNRLQTAMLGQIDALSVQHQGDPAGLTEAIEALRQGYVQELPPAQAAAMTQSFERAKVGAVAGAVREYQSQLESQNLASFEEAIEARTQSALRIASKAGLDERSDQALAAELDQIDRDIDASPMTPLQKSRLKRETRTGAMGARVLAGFENLTDPAARAEYLKAFETDWQDGEGYGGMVDAATFQTVKTQMMRQLQADEVAADRRRSALEKSIDGQVSFLKKGYPVDPRRRAAIAAEVAATGDEALAANLDFLDNLSSWQSAHLGAHPSVVEAQIETLKARIQREGMSEAALVTLDVMEGLHKEMTAGLKADPLTWANRAGVAEIVPLDFSDQAGLAVTLSDRAATAEAIGKHYGAAPKYFLPNEIDALQKQVESDPLQLPAVVSALREGLGRAAPAAFAEISADAPVLAHVAGLYASTGDQKLVVEAGEALAMRRVEGYKANLPTPAKLHGAATVDLGGALQLWPTARTAAIETATAIFERRAMRMGIDASDFGETSPARQLFTQALDEVLGARMVDGVKHGGLTMVNGVETVAPVDMPADDLEQLVWNLSADDLIFQADLGTANGVPITVDQLRGGKLIASGPGRYRVALGDPWSDDPRYVPDAAGGYFQLDVDMLRRTRVDQPTARAARDAERWREWQFRPVPQDVP
jgi:hypothetical protein